MYNVKAAVSRLPAGPETDRMEVTDIETGHFVFPPVPGEPLRRHQLYEALGDAGYEMTDAWLAATGELTMAGALRVLDTGQPFVLSNGAALERLRAATAPGDTVSVFGAWKAGAERDTLVVERWSGDADLPPSSDEP